MYLNNDQLDFYDKNGFLFLPDLASSTEIGTLLNALSSVVLEDSPRKILEKNGSIRSIFGSQKTNAQVDFFCRMNKIIEPVRQILKSDIYIHQTKFNFKQAMTGDWWDWHQDFPYWHLEDGMPVPRVLTIMIYLDEVTEFNGPMYLVPGTHKAGLIDDNNSIKSNGEVDAWFNEYEKSTSYMSHLTSNLKYTLSRETLEKWINKNGIVSAKGKAGSAVIFHGNIFHASGNNLSPWDRKTFLITYNSIENTISINEKSRPDFLANRDFSPIVPVESVALL